MIVPRGWRTASTSCAQVFYTLSVSLLRLFAYATTHALQEGAGYINGLKVRPCLVFDSIPSRVTSIPGGYILSILGLHPIILIESPSPCA